MRLLSVNVGRARETVHSDPGVTGIDKRPASGPVEVRAPGLPGVGGPSGLAGDRICDTRHHGGDDQAVYAYAREDLDAWATELDRPLRPGEFGENLTTTGVDVTGALIGERWRIGSSVVVEVSAPRIPCRTFAGWLDVQGWVKTFTDRGSPGAYLRVIEPGSVQADDPVEVVHRPDHDVTVGLAFQALTTRNDLLPRLEAAADALSASIQKRLRKLK